MGLDFEASERSRAPIGVKSGTVMTVQGPLPVGEMGVTLDARAHPA